MGTTVEEEIQEAAEKVIEEHEEEEGRDPFEPFTIDELRISRTGGKLDPMRVITLNEGLPIEMLPITLGDKHRLKLTPGQMNDVTLLEPDQKFDLLKRKCVAPDFTEVSSLHELETEFSWSLVDEILQTIFLNSRDTFRLPIVKRIQTENMKKGVAEAGNRKGRGKR